MDKAGFDQIFDSRVAAPLAQLGFIPRGKTLFLKDDTNTIALIRLGGRLTGPGCVSHVLCFRHSMLRDLEKAVPQTAPTNPWDYPFKFQPSNLVNHAPSSWRYEPHNLRYPYDLDQWSSLDNADCEAWADRLAALIAYDFVPWAGAVTYRDARDQLRRHGENAYCERLWIDDYDRALEAKR